MPAKMQRLNWNDVQDFLVIARAGSLSRASTFVGIDATTIGRRLRRLERQLGQSLFEQTHDGQILTTAGEALLVRAEAMQLAAEQIVDSPDRGAELGGLLRVSASEGFGTWYIAHRLHEFLAAHPGLTIDLVASSGLLSPSKRETDIAIMLGRPSAGSLLCAKLVDYELGLYAASSYIARFGRPRHATDLQPGHRLIGYVPEMLYAPQLNYLDEIGKGLEVTARSTSINAQYRMIATGAGVGVLPYFIARGDTTLERLLPERRIVRSFWSVTHRDTRDLRRVRAFQTWLSSTIKRDREIFGVAST